MKSSRRFERKRDRNLKRKSNLTNILGLKHVSENNLLIGRENLHMFSAIHSGSGNVNPLFYSKVFIDDLVESFDPYSDIFDVFKDPFCMGIGFSLADRDQEDIKVAVSVFKGVTLATKIGLSNYLDEALKVVNFNENTELFYKCLKEKTFTTTSSTKPGNYKNQTK